MFGFHPDKQLVAYCHGELDAQQTQRVEAHLQRCTRCRAQAQALRQAHALLSHQPSLSAPETLWNRIEAALPAGTSPTPSRPLSHGMRRFRPQLALASIALILIGGLITWRVVHPIRPNGPALTVARLAGTPRVGSDRIGATGRLGVGEYLVTDAASRAEIQVANIGTVQVEPNTRIGLKATGPNEQRLALARGEMKAKVIAYRPPLPNSARNCAYPSCSSISKTSPTRRWPRFLTARKEPSRLV